MGPDSGFIVIWNAPHGFVMWGIFVSGYLYAFATGRRENEPEGHWVR